MTADEIKKDRALLDNKFTETRTIEGLAKKYGVKKAGRQSMLAALYPAIRQKLNEVTQNDSN